MATYALDGSDRRIDLGDGYILVAPAVLGVASDVTAGTGSPRARDFEVMGTAASTLFDAQLSVEGMRRERVWTFDIHGVDTGARAMEGGAPAQLRFTVPNEPGEGAVVLVEDEDTGALRWHVPHETSTPVARAFGGCAGAR